MTIPAFTAGASLYRTSRHYQSVANQIYGSGENGIIPIQLAARARPTGCAGLESTIGFFGESVRRVRSIEQLGLRHESTRGLKCSL